MEPGKGKAILDILLHDLYEVPILVVYNNIAKIVQDNIELTLNITDDSEIRYIRYEGEIYFSVNLPNYKDRQSVIYDQSIANRNMVMHDDIKEALLPEIAELDYLDKEQKECAYYLRIILNQCKSLHDVEALLPGAAWNLLDIRLNVANKELTLSETEIKVAHETYAEEAATVKERIFLNLLLRKV